MTEQETREKIVEVLKKSREEWEIITPSIGILDEPRVDIEIDNLADALIAAGIGFMDDDITSQIIATIKRDTEPITMENVALRKQVAEAEHRAERAERAFSKLVHEMYEHGIRPMCDEKFFTESRLKEAEKELAEGGERMTDEKLNGIIKALKLCTGIETACKDCPYRASVSPSFSVRCEDTLHKASLEAIETLKAENAALRERLGKWAVDNEIVMEARVKDGQTYYVISRKERRIVTHYICTELTPEAAEARLAELKGEKK